ncbi:MAG: MFS transporter [Deferribacteres bacterium]|nr:MFS transporter [candidate division KSB1 bacterium]MCB9503533.1 MFS transporter [Deferribacteres bacterium]
MNFQVKDHLSEQDINLGLKAVLKDGLTSQSMLTLTSGAFLVAFALELGASNLIVGLLAAIPPLAQLLQIPAIAWVEKIRIRKLITVYFSAVSRIFLLPIAIIPFFWPDQTGLFLLIIGLTFHGLLSAPSACAWNSWMRDLIPQDRLGVFFSKRISFAMALGAFISLLAGFMIDFWNKNSPESAIFGYSVLFALACAAGLLGIYFLYNTPEPRMEVAEHNLSLIQLLKQPFSDTNFKNLIVFLGTWNFAINLAAPFFTVYMLQRLSLNMTYVVGLTVLSQIFNFVFLRIWGKISDRFSHKSVISVSGPLFIFCIFGWIFTTMPEKYILTTPLLILLHVFMGISTAGVTLAAGNIGLKLAPKGQATAYLAAISFINSLAAGFAPIIGGLFVDYFAEHGLRLSIDWLSPSSVLSLHPMDIRHWDFFFLFAFLMGQYSLHRLALVNEVGHVEENIVIRELFTEVSRKMGNLSSVTGIRQLVEFPFGLLKYLIPVRYFSNRNNSNSPVAPNDET